MHVKLILILLVCLVPLVSLAQFNQWDPEDGVSIRSTDWVTYFKSTDTNENGNTLFAWTKNVRGVQTVFASLVNADGDHLWDNPVVINDVPGWKEAPSVYALNENEWVIAWFDMRINFPTHVPYQPNDIYFQKIDSSGNLLLNEDGVWAGQVPGDFPTGDPTIISNGDFGFFLFWNSRDNSDYSRTIYGQHVSEDGSILWTPNGLALIEYYSCIQYSDHNFDLYQAIPDGSGGAFLGVAESVSSLSLYKISMQHISSNGEILWGNTPGELEVLHQTNTRPYRFDMCSDGANGVYAVWDDSLGGEYSKLMAQRIDYDGDLYWDESATICEFDQFSALNPTVELASDLAAIVMFEKTDERLGEAEICLQKFDGEDNLNIVWDDQDCIILGSRTFDTVRDLVLSPDTNGGVVLGIHSNYDPPDYFPKVFYQHVNSDGQESWQDNGAFPLISGDYLAIYPSIANVGEGNTLFSWMAYTENSREIYYQLVDNNGDLVLDSDELSLESGIDGNFDSQNLIKTGDSYFVTWRDSRGLNHHTGLCPYTQKLDANGNSQFQNNGILLAPEFLLQGGIVRDQVWSMPDGQGGLISVWTYALSDDYQEIRMQHLDNDGNLQWPDSSYTLLGSDNPTYRLIDLVPLNNGEFIIIYTHSGTYDFQVNRYTSDGVAVWGEAVTVPGNGDDLYERYFSHCILNQDEIVFIYRYQNDSTNHFNLCKVSSSGEHMWDEIITYPHTNGDNWYIDPAIKNFNNNILVYWYHEGVDAKSYKACLFSPEGEHLWDEIGITLATSSTTIEDFRLSDNNIISNTFWASWSIEDSEHQFSLYTDRFDTEGNPQIGNGDGLLVDNVSYSFNTRVVPRTVQMDDNTMFYVWTDSEGILKFIHLDLAGGVVPSSIPYPEGGAELCNSYSYRYALELENSGDSGFVAIWYDYRRGLYAQQVNDAFTISAPEQGNTNPLSFKIDKTWPNPFNPSINISYQLANKSNVKIAVFDMLGREVAVLVNSELNAGQHLANWNGLNNNGINVSSGTYFIRMQAPEMEQVRKVVLVK